MGRQIFHQPDAAAMERLLAERRRDTTGIILRLVWREGLTRKELHALTWDEVDFEGRALRLPDREVPLEDETAAVLEAWRDRYARYCRFVAVSSRSRSQIAAQSIPIMVRSALNSAGMPDVLLLDLRYDFFRRQAEARGLPFALRVAGVSLTGYNNTIAAAFRNSGVRVAGLDAKEKPAKKITISERGENEFRLWRIMQDNRDAPGGIALWLVQQMGFQVGEIAALTWDDVDFPAGTIRRGDARLPMSRGVARVLREERARRRPGDDPHVILTVKSRKPPAPDRLSVLIRETLIRGGFDNITAMDVRQGLLREIEWRMLRQRLDERGYLTPADASELLELGSSAAWARLQALEKLGYVVHVGHKYYAAGKTPPAGQIRDSIRDYIAAKGVITCKQASELLGIPPRQVGYLLRTMAKNGELAVTARGKYALPAAGETNG